MFTPLEFRQQTSALENRNRKVKEEKIYLTKIDFTNKFAKVP